MAVITNSDVDICSQAFLILAEAEISSFEDETDTARLAKKLYPTARQFLLSLHPWQFRKVQGIQLSKSTTLPVTRWKFKYALPADRFGDDMRAVYDSASEGANPVITGFVIQDGHLWTDFEEIFVDYVNDGDESTWPPYFVTMTITYMAMLFALPVTDQQTTRDRMEEDFYGSPAKNKPGFLAMARAADSQPGEIEVIQDAPFIAARFV